jgi:hypothetical protein
LVDRCRCGDDSCAKLYTTPKPTGAYGPTHTSISLNPSSGLVILDLVDRQVVGIEILFREDIRNRVLQLFPQNSAGERLSGSDYAQ